MLALNEFKQVVANAPLFAIDLVVINSQSEILVGERKNAPAKGYWFVPGGRVYKNESIDQAFERISLSELGYVFYRKNAEFLGLYDHFYSDSFFNETTTTHYINATHCIKIEKKIKKLPVIQHEKYKWIKLKDIKNDKTVHKFSKVFLTSLECK